MATTKKTTTVKKQQAKATAKVGSPQTTAKASAGEAKADTAPAEAQPTVATARPESKKAAKPAETKAASSSGEKPASTKTKQEKDKKEKAKPEKKVGKDGLTPEEKARKAKLKATLALLKADPEWPTFLKEQKEALLTLRDQLLPNMQNVTRDHLRSGDSNVSSSSGQHIGDAGSEAEVRALTISLLGKDREQLFEIDAALERIRLGYYGICEVSLEPIPKKRLQARPFCRLTVKCQEEFEKKYGSYANYKAQKSDHVGYAGLQNDMESVFSLDEDEE